VPLETATYINDLVTSNPAHADGLAQADSHMRLIKTTLKTTLPGLIGPATRAGLLGGAHGFLADAGSAAAPAYSFSGNGTMGFYAISFANNVMGFTGTLRGNGAVPPGMIMDYAAASAPTGWLACDGQAISRVTFADLFAAIGTTWGAGDGSTTFNVPGAVSRYRRHRDGSALAGFVGNFQSPTNLTHTHSVVGGTGGADTDHSHTYSGTTSSMNRSNPHSHTYTQPNIVSSVTSGGAFTVGTVTGGAATGATDINHEHTFSGTTSGMSASHAHGINFASGASGDANEARPYSITVLTCIKT
jgi:microcystin-dependent protein